MYLNDILYKITEEQLNLFGLKLNSNLLFKFKSSIEHILNDIINNPELKDIFEHTDEEWNLIENEYNNNLTNFVNNLYELNRVSYFLVNIIPNNTDLEYDSLKKSIHYRTLYLSDSQSYINLMESNGCTVTEHTPGNYFIDGFIVLGTGTNGTGLLLPNNKVLKITSDEDEFKKDTAILHANKHMYDKFKTSLIHLPTIYELGKLGNDFIFELPTNRKELIAPRYSIKEYFKHDINDKDSSIISDENPYYKLFEDNLTKLGEFYNLADWDIHLENCAIINDKRKFV